MFLTALRCVSMAHLRLSHEKKIWPFKTEQNYPTNNKLGYIYVLTFQRAVTNRYNMAHKSKGMWLSVFPTISGCGNLDARRYPRRAPELGSSCVYILIFTLCFLYHLQSCKCRCQLFRSPASNEEKGPSTL